MTAEVHPRAAEAQASGGAVATAVLVVDDDPGIRGMLADVLSDEGYAVLLAEHGAEALEVAARHRPGVVVLDMSMPVMNGWEFAAAYRAAPGPHAPILVLTAGPSARAWCEQIGGDGWLAKPVEIRHLVDEVARLAARP